MKSIKEAANEYAKDYLFSPLAQRTPNIHFEAGANYVLEQLEEFLNLYGVYCINSSAKAYLKNMIEQLRKPINSRV